MKDQAYKPFRSGFRSLRSMALGLSNWHQRIDAVVDLAKKVDIHCGT